MKEGSAVPCEWSVNSKEHNYCFWRWIQDNSLPNGKFESLTQNETAALIGGPPNKVQATVKEALEKLKKSEYLPLLAEYNGGTGDSDAGDGADWDKILPDSGDSDPEY